MAVTEGSRKGKEDKYNDRVDCSEFNLLPSKQTAEKSPVFITKTFTPDILVINFVYFMFLNRLQLPLHLNLYLHGYNIRMVGPEALVLVV